MTTFQREFALTIDNLYTAQDSDFGYDGLRVQFKVTQTLEPEPNTCDLMVTNLSASSRGKIKGETGPGTLGSIVRLEAGYKGSRKQLFLGDVRTVNHTRDGTDWNTRIQAGDGEKAMRQGKIKHSQSGQVSAKEVLKRLIEATKLDVKAALQKVDTISIGDYLNGTALAGNAARHLTDVLGSAGYKWSSQDGVMHILGRGETTDPTGKAYLIGPKTGMLGSPAIGSDGFLIVKSLLLPDLRPGRRIFVDSAEHQGAFRAEKVTHSGDFRGEDWTTEIEARPL